MPEPLRAGIAAFAEAEGAIEAEARKPIHEPPLERGDEAVFLLTAAAEVEHALMVQYLFAAYSVRVVDGGYYRVKQIQDLLLQIAREEMGHLITVQNVLHVLGGTAELQPRAFAVCERGLSVPLQAGAGEPAHPGQVLAESPARLPADFPDPALYEAIKEQARQANDAGPVQYVGPIFARLTKLLSDPVEGVKDEDFRLDTAPFQGYFQDWGFSPGKLDDPTVPAAQRVPLGEELIITSIEGTEMAQVRAAADAIAKIGEQGEGFDQPPAQPEMTESHFERFFDIYQRFKTLLDVGIAQITWPIAENPNTIPARGETALHCTTEDEATE